MSRSMQRVVLFALAMMLLPTGMACRDQVMGDSYPMVLVSEGRSLLPTTARFYDPRILEGTAQAIGLLGDDGAAPTQAVPGDADPSDADSGNGADDDALNHLDEVVPEASGEPQPDQQDSDPDADDNNQ